MLAHSAFLTIVAYTEQSRSTGQVGCGVGQLDAALLPSLVITAESLLGPANGGLKPSGTLVFKHLIARFAISETEILEQYWG